MLRVLRSYLRHSGFRSRFCAARRVRAVPTDVNEGEQVYKLSARARTTDGVLSSSWSPSPARIIVRLVSRMTMDESRNEDIAVVQRCEITSRRPPYAGVFRSCRAWTWPDSSKAMSLIAPTQHRAPGGKAGARKVENNRIYGNPLPLLFVQPDRTKYVSPHRVLGLFGFSGVRVENPHCEGILDPATRSVWITNSKDAMILWQRGFFGKGNLSRSEPSWYTRQVNARKAAGKCTHTKLCSLHAPLTRISRHDLRRNSRETPPGTTAVQARSCTGYGRGGGRSRESVR